MHISFVRSIAMDSWPEQQLQLMKQGGNRACNEYLQKHGIAPRTPIKQKYESSAAQLYKLVLKARVEGRPEPTELPPPQKRQPYVSKSAPASGNSSSMGQMSQDANGMERLMGETDQQYIARQTRLREEAKARMAAKFGGSGMGGGGGGSGSGMQGIGSDPSYNPNGGYGGGGGGDLDVNSMISGFGSMLGSAVNSAKTLADEQTVNSLKSSGASFWGGLTSSVSQIASTIAAPDEAGMDGLSELQRQAHAQASTRSAGGSNSKYAGFGSDSMTTMNGSSTSNYNNNNNNARTSSGNSMGSANSGGGGSGGLQEAPGLPGEDRNGVGRLSGETDEQYVVRQTRLRDEARARMAAKFGGGGAAAMGGVGSSSSSAAPAISSAPGSGNRFATTGSSAGPQSAPGSGNAPKLNPSAFPRPKTPPKKVMNSTDFFSSFGE